MKTYLVNINDVNEKYQYYYLLVNKERQNKIDKYKFIDDKCRSLAAGLLINSVAKFYGISEEIATNEYGKPYFVHNKKIYFNVSHSGQFVVCTFGMHSCGVDIEEIKEADLIVAKRFFTSKEYEWVINSKDKNKAFFIIWTLKESYLKAIGKGILVPLNSFDVTPPKDYESEIFCKNYNETNYYFKVINNINYGFSICSTSKKILDYNTIKL